MRVLAVPTSKTQMGQWDKLPRHFLDLPHLSQDDKTEVGHASPHEYSLSHLPHLPHLPT